MQESCCYFNSLRMLFLSILTDFQKLLSILFICYAYDCMCLCVGVYMCVCVYLHRSQREGIFLELELKAVCKPSNTAAMNWTRILCRSDSCSNCWAVSSWIFPWCLLWNVSWVEVNLAQALLPKCRVVGVHHRVWLRTFHVFRSWGFLNLVRPLLMILNPIVV